MKINTGIINKCLELRALRTMTRLTNHVENDVENTNKRIGHR
jgi:hypothetical protein